MKPRISSRYLALILICSLFCSMFCLPLPANAAVERETYTARYGINAHWVEKDGLKDQYAELDLLVQLPFLRGNNEPMDILFIADVSTSMDNTVKGEYPSLGHYNTLSPLSAIKNGMDLCADFLSESSTDDRFGLIAFSSKVERSLDFTDNAANFQWEVLHLASQDSIGNYYAALTAAKEMLETRPDKSRPARIVFMTDGEPDIQRAQAAAALKDLANYADIYAVQLGCTVDMLSDAAKAYRADTTEEMLNSVPFALSDIAQCGKWSQVNISIPASGDFIIGQANPAETYGASVVDSSGIKYTGVDVPSGVTYTLHYPLTLADTDTLKTKLTVNTGGTFNFAAPNTQPSPPTAFEIQTLDRPRYTVTYDGNGNTEGSVPIDTNRYAPGSMIEYPDAGDLEKEVDGKTYQFQGWRVKKPSFSHDYGSHFSIYDDTVVEATWTTASVAKTSNTRGEMPEPILMSFFDPVNHSEVEEAFHQRQYKDNIVSATFLDRISIPTNAETSWDVSAAKDGSVMAWVTPAEATGTYDLFIAGNGGVIANPNSAYLFGGVPSWSTFTSISPGHNGYPFSKLERINGLENLDTSRVTNMYGMFRRCEKLKSVDISGFDTSNVTNMSNMFYGCGELTAIDLSSWDTSKVNDMSSMFYNCNGLTAIPVPPADTSNVTDMNYMFGYCRGLTSADLNGWNTSNVTNMSYMFYNCSELTAIDLSACDTSNVTDMSNMFCLCSKLASIDLSSFDTSNVTDMSNMFYACSGLTAIDLSSFDTSNVTDMNYMFSGCSGLANVDLSAWDTKNVTNMSYMFRDCSSLTSIPTPPADTSKVTDMSYMFYNCQGLTNADLSAWDTKNVTNMNNMFGSCTGLTSIPTPPTDTSNVTDMSYMFSGCIGLTNADLSAWDTSNVTNTNHMFANCIGLTSIPTPPADTRKLESMVAMFSRCSGLTNADLSGWDTSNVTTMNSMFENCTGLTSIPTPPADTSKLTVVNWMFSSCNNLTNADLSGWDLSNVTSLSYMFYKCSNLANVTLAAPTGSAYVSFDNTFANCSALTNLTLSDFDSANLSSLSNMFVNCSSLASLDISQWNLAGCYNISYMFSGCTNLTDIGTTSIVVAQNCYSNGFRNGSGLPAITINTTGAARAAAEAINALSDEEAQTDTDKTNFSDENAQPVMQALIIPDNLVQASMTAKAARAANDPIIIDMGEINAGAEIDYQITVKYEGDSDCYSGDIKITDPIPNGLTVKPDSISITANRIDPDDGLRTSYLVKQTPQVNDGVLSLCLTGLSTGSKVIISYTCTTPAYIADYKQFLNFAVMETDGRTTYTDTIRHWIGSTPEAENLYNVSYKYEGEVPNNAPALPQRIQYQIGETVTPAPTPSVPGYTFEGWKRFSDDTETITSFTMPDTDVELIGIWTKDEESVPATVNVKYEYQGNVPDGVPALPAERSHKINSYAIVAAKPVSDDYTFDGWRCDDGTKVSEQDLADGRFYVGETDTVLYGSWIPKTYNVSYEYTGTVPSGVPAPPTAQSYTWGTEVSGSAAPADTAEYVFSGWYTNADLDAAPPYTGFTMPKQDVIFRGSWSKRPYSVKYVYNGVVPEGAQSVLPAPDAFYSGDTVSIAADPTFSGYTFSGWSAESGLADGAVIDGSFTMPAGDVVLQGSWQKSADTHPSSSKPTKTPAALNTEEHTNYIIGRDGGCIKPLAEISRAETATIFFRLLTEDYRNEVRAESCNYTDVNSTAWHNLAISTLSNAEIINGYPNGAFRPDAPITRAEFAAIAARFDSSEYNGEALFPDVTHHWAADSIYRAYQKGWIKGYPDGTFRPDQYITRAEAITLINRVLERDGEALGDPVQDAVKWSDVAADAWYYDAIREATNSHSYQRVNDGEKWLAIEPLTDWKTVEYPHSKTAK